MYKFLLIFEEAGGPMPSVHGSLEEVNSEISELIEECWDLDDSVSDEERALIFSVYKLENPIPFKKGILVC